MGWEKAVDPGTAKDAEGNINLILKLSAACGCSGKKGRKGSALGDYLIREARVISVGEVCCMFGHLYTAAEIYQYFINARLLSTRRPHSWTNRERRQAVEQHYAETACWGQGKGSAVGDVSWTGQVSTVRWWFGIPSWPLAAIQ